MTTTLGDIGGWKSILATLTEGRDLTEAEAAAAMAEILAGEANDAQIAGFIIALRMKGEAVEEVIGLSGAMLDAAAPIALPAGLDPVDIVGTGGAPGRRFAALNVSTMACFVAAGAGAHVLKHGNRKASSTSGSFDILEALGVPVELDGPKVVECLQAARVAFCFARLFHPAMRHTGPVRAALGVPTVMNFLGPLSHPARVRRQVIGVSDLRMAPTVVGVLQERKLPRAMVVHGHNRLDELTTSGPSAVFELRDGVVTEYEVDPAALGLEPATPDDVKGGDPVTNAAIARRVFAGEKGPHRDIVALNAAAGLVVAGVADDLPAGLDAAFASLDDGSATSALDRLVTAATS
ncbi:MAG: anthranilate phosphoribosyltransferase [Actinobacteria bacterium]|nr:anthranilate phosphoribosyltransferase [Actinomycetota bacterium]